MILVLSDLHLGRGSRAESRAAERDAVALLRAHEAEVVGGGGTLVLLGDVFHEYIEYRHLVPKTAPRLVGLLADWCDRGARVVYLVGNRDPWHLDFFRDEIGVGVLAGTWQTVQHGRTLYFAHGDGLRPAERLSFRLQPLLRSPVMARLFRMGLPGDGAFALARWISRRFGTDGTPRPVVHTGLVEVATERLRTTEADVVAFGHSHQEALLETAHGLYLNPGYWFSRRTFARLDADGAALLRWADGTAEPLARAAAASARPALAPSL
ncbi:MAG: metallophosphoesterase [Bacteroidota bacterium]